MIGKVMTGKAFGGCIRYLLEKEKATILDSDGIRTDSTKSIIYDFNIQRKLNPNLGMAVGHIALSWSLQDKDKLSPELMAERAKEYLDKMKITNTQYLIVQHQDRQHPHIHVVYNRVNSEGKTISDQFQKKRNVNVCKELTLKHGYYFAAGKENVNRQQLKGADQVKYQLYDTITKNVRYANSWSALEKILGPFGITIRYKYKSGTNDIQGVSFSKNGMVFKGSQIDRSLSYGRINQQIAMNQQPGVGINPMGKQPEFEQGAYEEIYVPIYTENREREIHIDWGGALDEFLKPVPGRQQDNDDSRRKKKYVEEGEPRWVKTYKPRRR
jgi:hypothetical protein